MEIKFLESEQISKELNSLFQSKVFDEIDFAVAYLSVGGFSSIKDSLNEFLERKVRLRLLIGMSGVYATQSKALLKLLALTKTCKNKRFELRFHNLEEHEFHPKMVLAKSNGILKSAIIGSSNLTSGGQKNNVEANILVNLENPSAETEKFEKETTQFFNYIWEPAEILTSVAIKKYAVGEEKKKKKLQKNDENSITTKLPKFSIFLDNERKGLDLFEVHCTHCKDNFVNIPVEEFFCMNCRNEESPTVDTPEPNTLEKQKIDKQKSIKVKIDGQEISAQSVDLRCVCGAQLGCEADFRLWVICKTCAKKKPANEVCKPFEDWNGKAKNLYYQLDERRVMHYT